MEDRHIIAVRLDEPALATLMREGATIRCTQGMPRDAKLLSVHEDFYRRCFVAFFEHPSFPICKPGCEPESRNIGYEVLEHPNALDYSVIPIKVGMGYSEYLDVQRWICERAAQIEGREYEPRI